MSEHETVNVPCKVTFNYIGEMPNFLERVIIESSYIELRHKYCELFNPMCEQWNNEFTISHPGLDGWSIEYNTFIRDKTNKLLGGELTNKYCYGRSELIGGLCDFVVGLKWNRAKKCNISMELDK